MVRSVEVSSSSEVRHTHREGEELGGHRVARVGGMPSSQVALLSAEDAAALGGVVKGSSQSPLFSGFWSQAHCIESRITLTGFAGVCCRFFVGKTLDGSLNGFFWRILRSREFHVCDPQHVRTFFFFDCRVLQGDCPKSPSFTGPVTVR